LIFNFPELTAPHSLAVSFDVKKQSHFHHRREPRHWQSHRLAVGHYNTSLCHITYPLIIRCAKDGAKIAIAAKTSEPHPKLPGTIFSAADEIRAAGGHALPLVCDIRDEAQVKSAIERTVQEWGVIDIVVNNASAISLTSTEETPVKRYDLMHQVNARGTWMVSKLALPFLKKSTNPHILNLSPPLSIEARWFEPHVAYTMAKFGMSMCVMGMAGEFRGYGVAVNALWPKTAIDTAAMAMIPGAGDTSKFRKPEIMADAAYAMLCQDSLTFSYALASLDDALICINW
jgi:citronellol/citronellal dehydrogenase